MPAEPVQLRLRDRRARISPEQPWIMGVVNASPESFSDGAEVGGLERQLAAARAQLAEGAHLLDVGGESGVTGVAPLSPAEEAERVVPLVEALVADGAIVSVDTWKPEVARAALVAGAHLINDVSGLRDPELADACAEHDAGIVLMHTRAEPKVKAFPRYDDVVDDVAAFLAERLEQVVARGVDERSVILDPGPDFAKTPAQTVAVLRRLGELHRFGRPVLLAVSRKDFVGAITGRRPKARLAGTLAAVADGVDRGATVLRVHDVAAVADLLAVRAALRGDVEVAEDLRLADHLRREPT